MIDIHIFSDDVHLQLILNLLLAIKRKGGNHYRDKMMERNLHLCHQSTTKHPTLLKYDILILVYEQIWTAKICMVSRQRNGVG